MKATTTQIEKVYNYMQEHGSITQLEALYEIGCMRLASRISELNKAGIKVYSRFKAVKCRDGSTAYVKEYSLKEFTDVTHEQESCKR